MESQRLAVLAADELAGLGRRETAVAIMCAEAVPWRCHRSLVGAALLLRGIKVEDILSATTRKPHHRTSFAELHGLTITYPPYDDPENRPKPVGIG